LKKRKKRFHKKTYDMLHSSCLAACTDSSIASKTYGMDSMMSLDCMKATESENGKKEILEKKQKYHRMMFCRAYQCAWGFKMS
jgi:hypothetical protein